VFGGGELPEVDVCVLTLNSANTVGFSLVNGLRNRLKFELYSALALINLLLAYRDLLEVLREPRGVGPLRAVLLALKGYLRDGVEVVVWVV